jgi:hypothetical protein
MEDRMYLARGPRSALLTSIVLLVIALTSSVAQEPPADQPPANVAGKWTIYSHDDNGKTATKYVELKQDGTKLTGHFKGPNQSGGLEGTIEGRHIVFHTKTRSVLTFRGQVDGDSMKGNYGIHGPRVNMQGQWEARREQ